jgi:alkanesulfonate monooxygenase
VIVEAGASEAGRQLAAETAEVIFGAAGSLAEGKAFYADIQARMTAYGRDPDHLKMPAALVLSVRPWRRRRPIASASTPRAGAVWP